MKHALFAIILQLAASGADAWRTDHNLQSVNRPTATQGREFNPIAAPFTDSRPKLIAYFSVTTSAKLIIPWQLRRHHHRKLATVAEILGIADSAGAAAWSGVHSTQ
jgi:hypothetical protein